MTKSTFSTKWVDEESARASYAEHRLWASQLCADVYSAPIVQHRYTDSQHLSVSSQA